jgi:hypothetical protein
MAVDPHEAVSGGKDEAPSVALKSSVKLTTNSKGHTWEVRVIAQGDTEQDLRDAADVATLIDRELAAKHGYPWARGG